MMNSKILSNLSQLAEEKGIAIVYACESGSRAWGFASPDSDYDVRFIYLHPLSWYLAIEPGRDVVELPVNAVLDISGWDMRKALQLMQKSNPVIFEWLQSPMVYREDPSLKNQLLQLAKSCFCPKTTMHHYFGMAHKAFETGLQEQKIKVKKYFYVLRPLLAALWAGQKNEIPPMEFGKLLELLGNQTILSDIAHLLEIKRKALEAELIAPIPSIHHFIADAFAQVEEVAHHVKKHRAPLDALNQFFFKLVASDAAR